jgi:hypothetical protein
MFTVYTVRGFVLILARPPPLRTKNISGSPSVTPMTAGFYTRDWIISYHFVLYNSKRLL